jgi:MoaA/NifB/PqqE/SkfB family radical SAM enzyme
MPVERVDLKLGFRCNNNCLSCPQAHRRHLGELSTERVKGELEAARADGATGVVLTGGEPTVREDLFELARFAKSIGFENIQLQTNGRMLYYKEFTKRLVDAGINDFCIGLHSDTAKVHDFLTRSPGSFDQAVQGIKNLKALNQFVAMNSVIHRLDFERLPKRAELAVSLKVDQFQLAFIHCCGNAAKNMDLLCPRKSEVKPFVHKALDIALAGGLTVMVEAYPYCFMQGYEKYCSDLYMPPAEVRDAEGVILEFDELRKNTAKLRGKECPKCRFFKVCEGPWREYPKKFGWKEFVPVKGPLVKSQDEILGSP